jgi:hypothetical protein
MTFRWEEGKCECQCCCDDLRRAGYGIGYLPGAQAWHRPSSARAGVAPGDCRVVPVDPSGLKSRVSPSRILSAFNRRDYFKFRRRFLRSLRASGNREPVTAVAYGLYPSEHQGLLVQPGIEVVAIPDNGVSPALRRVHDFQDVLARWPEETPVAYWDAGDVIFQDRIDPLWDLVRAHTHRLLVVRDAAEGVGSPVIVPWTNRIVDPVARRRTFELVSSHPFLNAGFAAGTAGALLGYLREAERLLNSDALRGVGPWGDQLALNVYCHTYPERWSEISPEWNFCLACRGSGDLRLAPDGRIDSVADGPIRVVHGTAGTLGWWGYPLQV